MEVSFDLQAFCKVILHATKYPHHGINGILVKKASSGDHSEKEITFCDCIPLLHMSKYVTPTMEIALAQVEQHCKRMNYEIAGYYQANQNLNDNSPDFVSQRIMDKLAEANPNVILVMVDNNQLDSNLDCAPFIMYQIADGKFKLKEAKVKLQPDQIGALSSVSALIQAKVYRNLVDFDNHLDDITLNYWLNPDVSESIQQSSC
jgi:hypothetical protein